MGTWTSSGALPCSSWVPAQFIGSGKTVICTWKNLVLRVVGLKHVVTAANVLGSRICMCSSGMSSTSLNLQDMKQVLRRSCHFDMQT